MGIRTSSHDLAAGHTTPAGLTYIRHGCTTKNMAKKSAAQAPLTPAVLHILLVLSTGGAEAESQGQTKMGSEMLYGSMGRMMEAGLILESDKRVDPETDD